MNPTYHAVVAARLELSHSNERGEPVLYTVHAQHKPDAVAARLPLTHVPEDLVSRFEGDEVAGFHVETLAFGDLAAMGLAGRPLHAVVAVKLRDGSVHVSIPATWLGARRRQLVLIVLAFTCAVVLTVSGQSVLPHLAALALSAAGTWKAFVFHQLRCVPFEVGLSFGDRERPPERPPI